MAVSDIITDARGYTSDLVDTAGTAMEDSISMLKAIGYVVPNVDPAIPPTQVPPPDIPSPPTLDPIDLMMPEEPGAAPEFQDIGEIVTGESPEFTASPPTFVPPSTPSGVSAFLDTAPSINTDIEFPDPPAELMNPMIAAPNLPDRVEPERPTIALPGFDAVAPDGMPDAPTDYEARFARAYSDAAPSTMSMIDGYVDAQLVKINPQFHTQMSAIEAQLTRYLAGGTGLNAAAEDAIYERARGKTSAEARRVQDEAWATMAERGFTLPAGSQMSAIRQARQAAADNNAAAAREIVVMQAEYEQKNLQFAVTQSAALRGVVLNATLSYMQNLVTVNGQALEYAKTVLSAVIEVYNTAVKAFAAKLDAYKAETAVYEVRLKAAMSYIDLYQAEINALAALTNMDHAKVDVYKAKIDALTSLSNVYRAQIEAVQGRVSLEKLQLDVFQARVQAFTAQVQGKNAEWQGYTAAVEGETAKVRVFSAQADAYNAQVSGYKAKIEAESERVRAQAATNAARAANYSATLQGFTAVVQARGEKARATIDVQRQALQAYTAQVQATVASFSAQSEYYRSVSDVVLRNADLSLRAQIEHSGSVRAFGASIAQLGTSNAQIYSSAANASLSGMNTLTAAVATEA